MRQCAILASILDDIINGYTTSILGNGMNSTAGKKCSDVPCMVGRVIKNGSDDDGLEHNIPYHSLAFVAVA